MALSHDCPQSQDTKYGFHGFSISLCIDIFGYGVFFFVYFNTMLSHQTFQQFCVLNGKNLLYHGFAFRGH